MVAVMFIHGIGMKTNTVLGGALLVMVSVLFVTLVFVFVILWL